MGSSLNPEQLAAVEHKTGPLLIVAGAGTGKTTVVTEKIKWLLSRNLARPEEILALTFTEKAAREMEERVDKALPYGTFGMWIMTFHSFCDRILKSEALHIGLNPHYKLLTEAETYLLVKKNFWKFNLKYFRPSGNPYKFIDGMIQHFSRLKDEDVSVEQYLEFAKNQKGKTADDKESGEKYLELANAYKVYEELKIAEGVMDFSDLISNVLKLFRERKSVLAGYHKQFKYILVDEFQDTNFAQYELIKTLAPAAETPNLTVVGDDSQSIYKFRGAAISNILSFMKDYPKAKQIILTKNYRSTQKILDSAYKLIKHNDPDTLEARLGINKNLLSETRSDGEDIKLIWTDRLEEEAEQVVREIKETAKKDKRDWKDFAILVRANNHSDAFVRSLERARIPFQFLGPGMLFRQAEVKDLIAYLKVLSDFNDSVSLYRVLSMDVWGIAQRDLIAVLNYGKRLNLSLFETLEKISATAAAVAETTPSVQPAGNGQELATVAFNPRDSGMPVRVSDKSREQMTKFVAMVHRHQELIPKETGGQVLFYFLQDSGLLKNITDYKTAVDERRALNMTKFFDRLKTFESTNTDAGVFAIVDYLDLAMEMGESPLAAETDWSNNNAVNILTIHSAKGLEFPVVFLVNLTEGRFPTRERREQIPVPDKLIRDVLPVGDYHLEEERRLFYVGMTRARDRLFFSAANFYGEGKRERKMSPFVSESLGDRDLKKFTKAAGEKQLPLFEWVKPSEQPSLTAYHPATKIDYLSYSAIQAFKECPLHFKLRYIMKIPTPTTAPLSMGNSIHLALRDFYRDPKDILKSLADNWSSEGYASKKHETEAREKAERFLTEYLKTDLHKTAKPLFLEQPFTFRINDLKIGGKIDRVDEIKNGEIEIIDYKTGAKVPEQKEIDADMQMTIYALAAADPGILGKNIEKVKLSFYFFDNQTKISTVRTREQLEEAKKELLKIRDDIEHSDFLCSGGLSCQNCEFKMLCG